MSNASDFPPSNEAASLVRNIIFKTCQQFFDKWWLTGIIWLILQEQPAKTTQNCEVWA